MHEQADETAVTSPLQLLNSVGMAAEAVVVPARNAGQNVLACSSSRESIRLR